MQVRGAACIASGQTVRAFPDDSAPFLDEIYLQWETHLDDNVFSVRQDAAAAMGDFLAAHGDSGWDRVLPVLKYVTPNRDQAFCRLHDMCHAVT